MATTNHTTHMGALVAERIKSEGLSLRQAAALADIPPSTLSKRLRAQNPDDGFRLSELVRIAAVLGTTAGALMSQYEEKAA